MAVDTPVATDSLTLARSELAEGMRAAASIKAPAVEVQFAYGQLNAYTVEVAVGRELPVEGLEGAASIFVDRARLASILAYCTGTVVLSADEDKYGTNLRVESGPSSFELRGLREQERYGHVVSHDPAGTPVVIEAATLVETLRRVLPFVSKDFTRPILTNVALFPTRNLAAGTDSYRLAIVRYGDDLVPDGAVLAEDERPQPLLLQQRGATSMQRLLAKKLGQVAIYTEHENVQVTFEDLRWSLRAERGQFPDWEKLLPEEEPSTVMKVDREDLLTGARAANALGPRNAPLILTMDPEKGVEVACKAIDRGTMTRRLESAAVEGDPLEMGLNPEFVGALCAAAPVERLTVNARMPLRPILVEAARDRYLLMPIRLNV